MPRSLPANPSISFIQREAKDIFKAYRNGDISCCDTLRVHPKFLNSSNEEILKTSLSLQEVQHALSIDYGFRNWSDLKNSIKAIKLEERKKDYAIIKKPGFDVIAAREGRYFFENGGNIHEIRLMWNELQSSKDYGTMLGLNTEGRGPVTGADMLTVSIFDKPLVPAYYMTYYIGVEKTVSDIPLRFKTIHVPEATWAVFCGSMSALTDYIDNVWFPASGYKASDGPQLELYFQGGTVNQVWIPIEGEAKEVPLKTSVMANLPGKLWEKFEDKCLESDRNPDAMLAELIEQYLGKGK